MTATRSIDTTRFGNVEFTCEDIVTFVEGVVGFPAQTEFVLIAHKDNSPYRWLQSIQTPDLAFLVVDPAEFIADYAPELPATIAQSLDIDEQCPRLVYTIVTIPRGRPEEMTLNLAGPILINLANNRAKQIVLEDENFPIRFKVFASGHGGSQAA